MAGQQAENLLDLDDEPATNGEPSGLDATVFASTPAAVNLLAGTSNNPLDDLVSIFGGSGGGTSNTLAGSQFGRNDAFGSPNTSPSVPPQTMNSLNGGLGSLASTAQQPQDDLLGLF